MSHAGKIDTVWCGSESDAVRGAEGTEGLRLVGGRAEGRSPWFFPRPGQYGSCPVRGAVSFLEYWQYNCLKKKTKKTKMEEKGFKRKLWNYTKTEASGALRAWRGSTAPPHLKKRTNKQTWKQTPLAQHYKRLEGRRWEAWQNIDKNKNMRTSSVHRISC